MESLSPSSPTNINPARLISPTGIDSQNTTARVESVEKGLEARNAAPARPPAPFIKALDARLKVAIRFNHHARAFRPHFFFTTSVQFIKIEMGLDACSGTWFTTKRFPSGITS